jgi:hypothetical protein
VISSLRYTLVTDGTSDRALFPIIRWALLQTGTELPLIPLWAIPRSRGGTVSRIPDAIEDSLCDLLFVHRDAEKEDPENRYTEIKDGLSTLADPPPIVCIVPVRMTEAWLLFDEAAIRRAADNPNGKVKLHLPSMKSVESLPDPKEVLNDLLCTACDFKGRRLDRFQRDLAARRIRVADFITDYSLLRRLSSFQRFEEDTRQMMTTMGCL